MCTVRRRPWLLSVLMGVGQEVELPQRYIFIVAVIVLAARGVMCWTRTSQTTALQGKGAPVLRSSGASPRTSCMWGRSMTNKFAHQSFLPHAIAEGRFPNHPTTTRGARVLPEPTCRRPGGCRTVVATPSEAIVAIERRSQRLVQQHIDDLFAGRVPGHGVPLEDAAKRLTDIETKVQTKGAATERRLMEHMRALSEYIPDIAMQAAGDACRTLLSDVAQTAGDNIAQVRLELHDALAESATPHLPGGRRHRAERPPEPPRLERAVRERRAAFPAARTYRCTGGREL